VSVVLVGLSHRTAPVEVRERHVVGASELGVRHEKLLQAPELAEGAILSTCNRTEVVVWARDADEATARLRTFLRDEIGDGSLRPEHCYDARNADAVAHLLRVASSLDSMVVGEAQILGQIKAAYRAAVEARAVGPILHRLFQRAFRAAKRVRSETGLGASTVSVARIGVQLASEIFESFESKRVLLVGAGDMAESALLGLRDAGARSIVVLNRSPAAAMQLAARFGGTAASLDRLFSELAACDIAITSVQVSEPLVTRAGLEPILAPRRGRPLLVVDLGLPRNVESALNELDGLYLYDLDDLETLATRGAEARRSASRAGEVIVSSEVESFERWLARLGVTPTIRDLVERVQAVALEEARRRAPRGEPGSAELGSSFEQLAEAIAAKLLHRPLERLRREAEEREGAYYAEAVRDLFALNDVDPEAAEE
jgi:glutamyl-tRNA reductase